MGVKNVLTMINPCFKAVMERGTVYYVVYNIPNATELPEFIIVPILFDAIKFSRSWRNLENIL